VTENLRKIEYFQHSLKMGTLHHGARVKNAFPPRFDQQQKNNGAFNNMVASNSTQESLAQSKK
jgi:hypothetical protein